VSAFEAIVLSGFLRSLATATTLWLLYLRVDGVGVLMSNFRRGRGFLGYVFRSARRARLLPLADFLANYFTPGTPCQG
jgi:hypothetical protein